MNYTLKPPSWDEEFTTVDYITIMSAWCLMVFFVTQALAPYIWSK